MSVVDVCVCVVCHAQPPPNQPTSCHALGCHPTIHAHNPARRAQRSAAQQAHLWVCRLRQHAGDGVGVAAECKHLQLGAHVPHATGGVAAARHDEVQRGVQRDAVHARQVAVVVADHLQETEREAGGRQEG